MSDQDAGPAPRPTPTLALVPRSDARPPEHARDTTNDPERSAVVAVSVRSLFEVLEELRKLTPCHRNPDLFHERKDELCARLYDLATRPSLVLEA